MNTREFWLSKRFSDVRRYPYGFSRSGDFTIRQSTILEQYGYLLTALINDEVSDPTPEDLELKQALLNNQPEYSEIVSIWLKYRTINHIKISVSSSAKVADLDDNDDEELVTDLDEWDDD